MEPITSDAFPELSIPLSMGVRSDDIVSVSGQGPLDLEIGDVLVETVREQTRVTLENVRTVLDAAGLEPADVVSVTAYLTDGAHYEAFNEAYAAFFDPPYPARSCLVTDLVVEGIDVEIEAIARR